MIDIEKNETSSLGANKTDPMWCYENYEASAERIDQQAQEIAKLKEKLQCYKEESVAEIVSLNKVCLELQNENLKQYKYTSELQAHINVLCEALATIKLDTSDINSFNDADRALATTPAQSMIQHDNEMIERCAEIVWFYEWIGKEASEAIVSKIRALKVNT